MIVYVMEVYLWDFFQNQILSMKWLNVLIGNLLTSFGININERLGGTIHFFIYDVIKIIVLLCTLIFMISYVQSYFPPERTKKILGKFHGPMANLMAALLGTLTPFCSCSSIPLFIGFTSAGLPLGVTFSFLISSPMVDLGSLVLLMSIFGTKVAIVYVILGLLIAVVSGTIIERLSLEDQVEEYILKAKQVDLPQEKWSGKDRLQFSIKQVEITFKKVFPYILMGVGIGAFIHNWIPEDWILSFLGNGNPFSVFLAAAAGVPMYADIFGYTNHCRSFIIKRSQTWCGPFVYDECDHFKYSFFDFIKESDQTQIIDYIYVYMRYRNSGSGILL